jgi:hypothetical protein
MRIAAVRSVSLVLEGKMYGSPPLSNLVGGEVKRIKG